MNNKKRAQLRRQKRRESSFAGGLPEPNEAWQRKLAELSAYLNVEEVRKAVLLLPPDEQARIENFLAYEVKWGVRR